MNGRPSVLFPISSTRIRSVASAASRNQSTIACQPIILQSAPQGCPNACSGVRSARVPGADAGAGVGATTAAGTLSGRDAGRVDSPDSRVVAPTVRDSAGAWAVAIVANRIRNTKEENVSVV